MQTYLVNMIFLVCTRTKIGYTRRKHTFPVENSSRNYAVLVETKSAIPSKEISISNFIFVFSDLYCNF